jgi:deoxyribose-phosphate aldolase
MNAAQIASLIDHTLLKPETSAQDIRRLCAEAKQFRFAAVCVNPYWVPLAVRELEGTGVKVATVVGFPLGASDKEVKGFEAGRAIGQGASEIDMVLNIGALLSGDITAVKEDISYVAGVCKGKAALKVIIETGCLSDEEKRAAASLCKEAGADFVKTSTGFVPGGAAVEDIELIRSVVGPELGIKASGGVRDAEFALQLIKAGATRLGTSSGAKIVKGQSVTEGY